MTAGPYLYENDHKKYWINKETAEQYRKKPCPRYGGPLHFANYFRKPRGESVGLPEECFLKFSLCSMHFRLRVTFRLSK